VISTCPVVDKLGVIFSYSLASHPSRECYDDERERVQYKIVRLITIFRNAVAIFSKNVKAVLDE
jgi:hypothetical protein